MKTSKRLWALLLTVCMVLAMIPAVSAAGGVATEMETYNFNYASVCTQDLGSANPGLTWNEITIENIKALHDGTGMLIHSLKETTLKTINQQYLNWYFVGSSSSATKQFMYNADTFDGGYFDKMAKNNWVAFAIDNPGQGKYTLKVNHAVSGNGAEEIGVYILPGGTATDKIGELLGEEYYKGAYKCYEDGQAVDAKATKYTSSNLDKTWKVEGNDSYIVVFRTNKPNTAGTARMYLSQLVLTPVAAEKEDEAEIVGGTTYDSVEEAISAATSGQTVKLLTDADASSAVELGTKVTLDLNGKKLTAPSVNATAPDAKVKDGSNGQGLLAVSQNTENATYLDVQVNNGQLPLYDAAEDAAGYRFFDFSLQSIDDVENGANTRRFWFKLTLNEKAYELIATGNSGLIVKTGWTWNGEAINGIDNFVFQAATVTGWADAMLDAENYGFYLDVTGFDSVVEDGILAVTPKIESAGIEIPAASAIEYAHNAA